MRLDEISKEEFKGRLADTAMCEYADCEVRLPKSKMHNEGDTTGGPVWVCPSCIDKMEDPSGYCSISCQLGYGCDDSC